MEVYGGKWKQMKENWRWKKVNEREKRKVKEVEEAMLEIEVCKSLWEMSGKMGHMATC